MPKLKTNRSAKKRFRITKNGKVMCANGYKNHLLESKSSKRKRKLRRTGTVDSLEAAKIKRLMPYA
jgi:large subunit ribosomal protein L35